MRKMFISFDLDGTIVKPDYNELIWFKEIPMLYAKKHGTDIGKAKKIVMKEYQKVGEGDLRWYILGYWLKHFGLAAEERNILEKYAKAVEVYSEAIPVLDELRKSYVLVVSSAMPRNFIDVKLRCEALFSYFERIFSAVSDFQMTKKESTFYNEICHILKISPSKPSSHPASLKVSLGGLASFGVSYSQRVRVDMYLTGERSFRAL